MDSPGSAESELFEAEGGSPAPKPKPKVVPASASDLDPKDVVLADDKVSGKELEYGIFGDDSEDDSDDDSFDETHGNGTKRPSPLTGEALSPELGDDGHDEEDRANLLLDQLGLAEAIRRSPETRGGRGDRSRSPRRQTPRSSPGSPGSPASPGAWWSRDDEALPKKNAMNDGPIVIRAPVKTEEQKRQGIQELTIAEQEVEEQRLVLQAAAMAAQPATRKASDAFNDGASDATTEAAEGCPENSAPRLRKLRGGRSEEMEVGLEWLEGQLYKLSAQGLHSFADRIHKDVVRRGNSETPYKVMLLLGEAFLREHEERRRKVFFYAFNELCRPLRKDPNSSYAKVFRHASWNFLKTMTIRSSMSQSERSHYARFLRRHSNSNDEASFIWRAAGDSKDTKDWHERLSRWEANLMSGHAMEKTEPNEFSSRKKRKVHLEDHPN
eukprot:symbB.v1.2.027142.t1/scaffold2765.1/size71220/1